MVIDSTSNMQLTFSELHTCLAKKKQSKKHIALNWEDFDLTRSRCGRIFDLDFDLTTHEANSVAESFGKEP